MTKDTEEIIRGLGLNLYVMGTVLSGLISFSQTQNLGWTLLHIWLNWLYVVYALGAGYVRF